MKANHRIVALLVVALGILTMNTGCKKFRENREYFTLQDHNAAENTYLDIFRLVCQKSEAFSASVTDSCYTVAHGDTSYPRTYTFTFVQGCRDQYQATRTGTLTIVYDKDFTTSGAVASVTLGDGYGYNGYLVKGNCTITNKGNNSAGHTTYELAVAGATVSTPKDGDFSWKATLALERTDAVTDPLIFDDVYSITGPASGTDHEGHAFQVAINGALEKEQACRWPRKGTITIQIDGLDEKEVDYAANECTGGSVGCCDNTVNVKTDGKREEKLKLE